MCTIMRMILKNVGLSFLSKKKKYFKDIISSVNEFGGGYYPVIAGSETTKKGNIIESSLNVLPLKYKLETGHTYLFGINLNINYVRVMSSNTYDMNGLTFKNADTNPIAVSIVSESAKKTFKEYPYLTLVQASTATNNYRAEMYLYDITGEDENKFKSFTFEQLRSGTIYVYEE